MIRPNYKSNGFLRGVFQLSQHPLQWVRTCSRLEECVVVRTGAMCGGLPSGGGSRWYRVAPSEEGGGGGEGVWLAGRSTLAYHVVSSDYQWRSVWCQWACVCTGWSACSLIIPPPPTNTHTTLCVICVCEYPWNGMTSDLYLSAVCDLWVVFNKHTYTCTHYTRAHKNNCVYMYIH